MVAAVEAGERDLAWLRPPIVWHATRLAVEANATVGTLLLQGMEGARAVTAPLRLSETAA
jgi:hypothetical protein